MKRSLASSRRAAVSSRAVMSEMMPSTRTLPSARRRGRARSRRTRVAPSRPTTRYVTSASSPSSRERLKASYCAQSAGAMRDSQELASVDIRRGGTADQALDRRHRRVVHVAPVRGDLARVDVLLEQVEDPGQLASRHAIRLESRRRGRHRPDQARRTRPRSVSSRAGGDGEASGGGVGEPVTALPLFIGRPPRCVEGPPRFAVDGRTSRRAGVIDQPSRYCPRCRAHPGAALMVA